MKSWVSFLADIAQILSLVAVPSIALLTWLSSQRNVSVPTQVWILVAAVAVISPAFYLLTKRSVNKGDANQSLEQFSKSLPTNEQIVSWFDTLYTAAKKWDPNASITEHQVQIMFLGKYDQKIHVSLGVHSKLRKLDGHLYFSGNDKKRQIKQNFFEVNGDDWVKSRKPFFHEFENWRRAIESLYAPIEHVIKEGLVLEFTDALDYSRKAVPVFHVNMLYTSQGVSRTAEEWFTQDDINRLSEYNK